MYLKFLEEHMSKIAFVYPGQGVQTVGMAQDFYENSVFVKRSI